jgi:putative membrane protein
MRVSNCLKSGNMCRIDTVSMHGGNMRRVFYVVVAIVVALFGISFAFQNRQTVDVNYYFGLSWNGPLALALFGAVAVGVVIGFLASLRTVLRLQRQATTARNEIRQVEQEVRNLRALPIKDVI